MVVVIVVVAVLEVIIIVIIITAMHQSLDPLFFFVILNLIYLLHIYLALSALLCLTYPSSEIPVTAPKHLRCRHCVKGVQYVTAKGLSHLYEYEYSV